MGIGLAYCKCITRVDHWAYLGDGLVINPSNMGHINVFAIVSNFQDAVRGGLMKT